VRFRFNGNRQRRRSSKHPEQRKKNDGKRSPLEQKATHGCRPLNEKGNVQDGKKGTARGGVPYGYG
jgi:hypothetical protein